MKEKMFLEKLKEFLTTWDLQTSLFIDEEFVRAYDFCLGYEFKLFFIPSGHTKNSNSDKGEFKLSKILMKNLEDNWISVKNLNELKAILSGTKRGLGDKTTSWIYYGGTKILINLANKRRMFKVCYPQFPMYWGEDQLTHFKIAIPKTLEEAIESMNKLAETTPHNNIKSEFNKCRVNGNLSPEIQGVEDFETFEPTRQEIEWFLLKDLEIGDVEK